MLSRGNDFLLLDNTEVKFKYMSITLKRLIIWLHNATMIDCLLYGIYSTSIFFACETQSSVHYNDFLWGYFERSASPVN